MKYVIYFMFLGVWMVSLVICFVAMNRILQALSRKEKSKGEKWCGKFFWSLICAALSMSICVALNTLEKYPDFTIGLLALEIFGAICPLVFGGGCALYTFHKALKKMKA